jgi:hypothetical protein
MPLRAFVEVPVRGPDGRVVDGIAINPIKPYVRGYWIADPDNLAVALAAQGAAGDSATLEFLVTQDGHFDWTYIVGTSTGAYSLEFFDQGRQRRLQNRPVHSQTVVGTSARPFRMPIPYRLNVGDAERVIRCTIRNLTGTTNTVRLAIYGRRWYHREAPPDIARDIQQKMGEGERTLDYFLTPNETGLDGTVTAVAGGGTATFTLESDDDAETLIHKIMFASTGVFQYRIRERATNRYISNTVLHNLLGWGNAEFPFVFADTYLLERKKQLLVEVTDLSLSSNSIYLTAACERLEYQRA